MWYNRYMGEYTVSGSVMVLVSRYPLLGEALRTKPTPILNQTYMTYSDLQNKKSPNLVRRVSQILKIGLDLQK